MRNNISCEIKKVRLLLQADLLFVRASWLSFGYFGI